MILNLLKSKPFNLFKKLHKNFCKVHKPTHLNKSDIIALIHLLCTLLSIIILFKSLKHLLMFVK